MNIREDGSIFDYTVGYKYPKDCKDRFDPLYNVNSLKEAKNKKGWLEGKLAEGKLKVQEDAEVVIMKRTYEPVK